MTNQSRQPEQPAPVADRKVLELRRDQLADRPAVASEPAFESEKIFRLQLRLDMERERELLYKVILVVLAIGALLLAREWALRLLA